MKIWDTLKAILNKKKGKYKFPTYFVSIFVCLLAVYAIDRAYSLSTCIDYVVVKPEAWCVLNTNMHTWVKWSAHITSNMLTFQVWLILAATKQSVCQSVRLSVRLSVCHTFFDYVPIIVSS